jgi:hypothetical protein
MAELDFERRLERLFAEPPAFPDEKAFAMSVERKLDRGWSIRRWTIGAAGMVGGVVGASQLIMSNFVQQLETASAGSTRLIESGMAQLAPRADLLSMLPAGSSMVWIAGGMAVLAFAFAVTRVLEEF